MAGLRGAGGRNWVWAWGAAIVAGGCAPAPADPDVFLVTFDDPLTAALQPPSPPQPTSDALLPGGARFTQATGPMPASTPALGTLLTGLWPGRHGSRAEGAPLDRPPLLPALLSQRGYQSAAVSASPAAGRAEGLGAGFGSFARVEDPPEAAQAVLRAARAATGAPLLLWAHLGVDAQPEGPAAAVSAVLHALDQARTLEDALVVVASVHPWDGSADLTEAGMRVSLELKGPGILPGPKDGVARLEDVLPTLLVALRQPTGATPPMDGLPLWEALRPDALPDVRVAVAEAAAPALAPQGESREAVERTPRQRAARIPGLLLLRTPRPDYLMDAVLLTPGGGGAPNPIPRAERLSDAQRLEVALDDLAFSLPPAPLPARLEAALQDAPLAPEAP